ncbi:MAG: DUF1800 family protein, partial [Sphingomonadales bacterium]
APECWAAQPIKFKSPWEWAISVHRALGTRELQPQAVTGLLTQLGQPIWRPGSPAGWDDVAAAWAGPDAVMRRDRPFPGRLELDRLRSPAFGCVDERAIKRGQITAGFQERALQPGHQHRRRLVPGEMARELGGDVPRSRRVRREHVEHRACLLFALLRPALAQDRACARLMQARRKDKAARRAGIARGARARAPAQPRNGPPRHRAGEFGDVGLAISGAHAERVQLHDLTGEILVEPRHVAAAGAPALRHLARDAVRPDRLRLIEIEQHRRMPFDRVEHIAEPAHHMRPDRVELERAGKADDLQFIRRDGKVIGPEMHQPLGKGCGRGQRHGRARAHRGGIIFAALPPCEATRLGGRGLGVVILLHLGRRLHRVGHCRLGRGRAARACLAAYLTEVLEIIGEFAGNLRRGWQCGDCLRTGLVTLDLAAQPLPGIAARLFARPSAQSESIACDACFAQRRAPSPIRAEWALPVAKVCRF